MPPADVIKVQQEFYCASSGGGCGGYFRVKLNMAIEGTVEVVCPNCGHKHQRVIDKGVIKEQGRYDKQPSQEIHTVISAYSKKPITQTMKDAKLDIRDGVVIEAKTIAERMSMSLFHRNKRELEKEQGLTE